ncbi:hypothetical protein M0R04_13380 [Candidatus Dojkabacteria bacterium]|jgi:hypothetical protein|nr:hypothetical protein [Candidatus Dojkabacteria bacterium]
MDIKYSKYNDRKNTPKIRCFCHWVIFKDKEELDDFHLPHQVRVRDMSGDITYFEL